MPTLMLSFLIFTFLLFTWVLFLFFGRNGKIVKRLDSYMTPELEDEKKAEKQRFILSKIVAVLNKKLKKKLATNKSNSKVELFLQSTGVSWSPGEYVIYRWMAAIICAGIIFLLTTNFVLAIVLFIAGFLYPKFWLASKRKKRLKKFNDGLADMISSIIKSLRAGFSFAQALQAVEEEVDSPIKEEVAIVLKEMQYGSNLEDALSHFYKRVPSGDLDIMIQAILIQRQVGGNLATVLSKIEDTIRERNKIYREVKTLTAQGRMSGLVIGLMPFVIGFLIYLIQPSYVSMMFKNPVGIIMMSCGFISGIIGFLLIRKLTKIEV